MARTKLAATLSCSAGVITCCANMSSARFFCSSQPETAKALALGWRQSLLHVAANVRDQPLDTRPELLTQRAELAGTLHHDCIERAVLSRRQLELACHRLAQSAPLLW